MGLPWYAFYPGDYARDTADLSLMEHGAYRLLLDFYYSTCSFLPDTFDPNYRICKASTPEEKKAVRRILQKYFVKSEGNFRHLRADIEINKQMEKSAKAAQKAAEAAKKRWEKERKKECL
jgi:uncharacterized protein YdaU (DUF1376 family)